MAEPKNEDIIAIWAKAVDTQMHFNEMCVKSRQLGLTFVTAALALGIVLIAQSKDFALEIPLFGNDLKVHVAVLLIVAAAIGLYAVRRLDLYVYHRMLQGAVTFGEDFTENVMKPNLIPISKGMTQAISHFSRHEDANTVRDGSGMLSYTGADQKSAEQKIRNFNKYIFFTLILSAMVLLIFTNLDHEYPSREDSTGSGGTKTSDAIGSPNT